MTELSANPKEDIVLTEGCSIDMFLFWKDKQVALEVDGPSHFLSGRGIQSATGATLFKHRQLRALGWQLAVVPYWEWANVVNSKTGRRVYLLQVLKQAVVSACVAAARKRMGRGDEPT